LHSLRHSTFTTAGRTWLIGFLTHAEVEHLLEGPDPHASGMDEWRDAFSLHEGRHEVISEQGFEPLGKLPSKTFGFFF